MPISLNLKGRQFNTDTIQMNKLGKGKDLSQIESFISFDDSSSSKNQNLSKLSKNKKIRIVEDSATSFGDDDDDDESHN